MPRITIDSFTPGIKAASGYTNLKNASASDIVNFDIDDYGRLTPRKGCEHVNSTVLNSAPQKMARVYAGTVKHLIVSIDDAQGLWYLNSGNFSELKNSSDSPAASVELNLSPATKAKFGHAVMSGRMFAGWSEDIGNSQENLWIDISSDPPVAYNHGISDAPPDKPTLSLSDAGAEIRRCDFYGSNITTIASDTAWKTSWDIVLDSTNSKIYYNEADTGKIFQADLDGSNETEVVTGLSNPFGLAVDETNSKLYWTDRGSDKIQYSDLDGSNQADVLTGLIDPLGIAVDETNSKIYWIDDNNSIINRADLDGANNENLEVLSSASAAVIEVNSDNSKIYWADLTNESIYRAALDASNQEEIVEDGPASGYGITVDTANNKIYFTDADNHTIKRCDYDGSNLETVLTDMGYATGIAIDETNEKIYFVDIEQALTSGNYYTVVTTFYRTNEAIESLPSDRQWVQISEDDNRLSITIDTSVDEQVDSYRVYCTTGQSSLSDAQSATLYYLTSSSDAGPVYYGNEADVSDAIDCADNDNPPNWRFAENHDGRLWVADGDDDYLYLNKLDSLGSPVLDAFPVSNVGTNLIPYKIAIGHEDGDIITGLKISPLGQQLIVFKRNSTIIVYGNDPDTIDVSHVINSAGVVAPFSIANVGGLLFFLTASKQIWICDGQSVKPISLQVNPLLENIPPSRFAQCTGINYYEKYLLCYPSGDNANDKILVYDADQSYWTTYDLPMNDLSWWTGNESSSDQDRLVGARSDSGYVDYLFEDSSGNDITQDNSSDITCVWQSNWIEFPSTATVTGVYVYPASSSSVTFSVRVDTDHTNGTAKTFTPSASNLYRQGFFKKGRLHRVRISVTDSQDTIPNIEKIEVEYQLK